MRKGMITLGVSLLCSVIASSEEWAYDNMPGDKKDTLSLLSAEERIIPNDTFSIADSLYLPTRSVHMFGVEARPGYIIPTNSFLRGNNGKSKPIRTSFSTHLKYSFRFNPNTYADRIYGGVYQGIGLAGYTFGDQKQLGNPISLYLFQGARITQVNPSLSFNYEWNFGLSFGWEPYDFEDNPYNKVIGSKVNAYINANFYMRWVLSHRFDMTSGINLTHFSNGNTKFPNAGLNAVGLKAGLVYNFNRKNSFQAKTLHQPAIRKFPRHVSYDLVLFGSWRRTGVDFMDKQIASPETYTVLGFNFAPMYNIGYKLRMGISLDGAYDGSANVYTEDYIVGTTQNFFKPSLNKQLSLGLSGRVEYIMPYFTVGLGMGNNVLHGRGDLKAFYQVVALKFEVIRSSYIHVGYSLKDFHTPNFLLLGIGFRFNNKYPTIYR